MASNTLQQLSENTVCSNLGKLGKAIKSCGGTVPQVDSVNLLYQKQSGIWSTKPLQLPAGLIGGENLQEFLDACSPAGLSENVADKTSYRDILGLEPQRFQVDFEVANTTILGNITSIMAIGSAIRAELSKLYVFSTDSHFKAHVNTPCSNDMFGSLMVCLPSQFTGGALVTRHQGYLDRQVTFDWSSTSPAAITHWAAFFSDVEFEVLSVTSGHQIIPLPLHAFSSTVI